jgi:uncharacterized membrane protein
MQLTSDKLLALGKRMGYYFLQGLLLLAPAGLTVYAIYKIFDIFDSTTNELFERLFHFHFPGFGIVSFIVFVTFAGFVGGTIFLQPVLDTMERLLEHTPLVKDIYSSFKDFFSAFLSNKKKFNKPVLVEMGKGVGIFRLGFITDDDLSEFQILDKVSVYCPMSYTFAGNLYIVNKDQVTLLPPNISANTMKYIVSGGVMEFDDEVKK